MLYVTLAFSFFICYNHIRRLLRIWQGTGTLPDYQLYLMDFRTHETKILGKALIEQFDISNVNSDNESIFQQMRQLAPSYIYLTFVIAAVSVFKINLICMFVTIGPYQSYYCLILLFIVMLYFCIIIAIKGAA